MTLEPIAIVFSKSECPYCVKASKLLADKGIHQIKRVVDVDFTRESLLRECPEVATLPKLTFPQIYINGKHIGGYDALVRYMEGK